MGSAYGRGINKRDINLTSQQRALLHVAKKELGLDDENYRSILRLYGGVESSKHLMLEGFERVIKQLERLGFQSTAVQKQPKRQSRNTAPGRDADGIPYPAQLHMIKSLFEQLEWTEPERQQGFCQRVIKKAWPQTRGEANKVFEGLKAMLARAKNK